MTDRREAQRIYNALFPYYAEVCVVTQYHKKGAQPGGWGGHAGMFLGGSEIEGGAGYPRLRLVANETSASDPDSGTGVSVNKVFRNVNWVGIPGRDEFFRGGLAPDATLDAPFYEHAIERATTSGWFNGIEITDALMRQRPATMPAHEFIVRQSIGTDFAVNVARTAYCARLPMSRAALGRVIGYLNRVNETAQSGGYIWNAYTNNCSHVAHNALAAAGVWDPKETRGPTLLNVLSDVASVAKALTMRRMSDFSFPANNFVRTYEAGNGRPIDDVRAAYQDHDIVRTLDDGWLTTGPGALIVTYQMHGPAQNELFTAGRDPFLFSVPRLWDKERTFAWLTRSAPTTVTDLGANLADFRERYTRILDGARPDAGGTNVESAAEFELFSDRFYDYVAAELVRTDARITAYGRLAGQARDV